MTAETMLHLAQLAFDAGILLACIGLRRQVEYTSRTADSVETQVRNVETLLLHPVTVKPVTFPGLWTPEVVALFNAVKQPKAPMARKRPARRKA